MGKVYSFSSRVIGSAETVTFDSSEIIQLKSALMHQITIVDGTATAGTLDVEVKYLGSDAFEALNYDGAALVFDFATATRTAAGIIGGVEAIRITPTGVDGTYTVSAFGWDSSVTTPSSAQEEILSLQDNVRGAVLINMNNDDYQMTAEESLCQAILVLAPGDGTKTLTLHDSIDNPSMYKVLVVFGGGTFTLSGNSGAHAAPVFTRGTFIYSYGAYLGDMEANSTPFCDAVDVTSADNSSEQVMHTILLPKKSLANNGDMLEYRFSARKSGTTNTFQYRLRFGSNGSTADAQLWRSAATLMTAAQDNLAAALFLMRLDSTTIRMHSLLNLPSPTGTTTGDFVDVTVPDLDTTDQYLVLTEQQTGTGETTNLETVIAKITRGA